MKTSQMKLAQFNQYFEELHELWKRDKSLFYEKITLAACDTDMTSRVARFQSDKFLVWGEILIRQDGFKNFIKLCDHLGIEPLRFTLKAKPLSIKLHELSYEDLKDILEHFECRPVHLIGYEYPFKAIEKMTNSCSIHLLTVWGGEENRCVDKFKLLYDSQQSYLQYLIKKSYPEIAGESFREMLLHLLEKNQSYYFLGGYSFAPESLQDIFKTTQFLHINDMLPVNTALNRKHKI